MRKIELNNNADFRKWNDEMASKYNPELYHKKSFFLIRLIEKLRVKSIIKLLAVEDNDKILEIGCGSGNIMEHFIKGRLFGIDLCGQLLRITAKKKYNVALSLVQSFAENIPFKSGVFNKIYCSEVLEHIREPSIIIQEGYRVLSENGLFVLSVPNEGFINFVKSLLHLFYLDKILNAISPYKFSICLTNEWHLHHFNLRYTREKIGYLFRIEEIRFVPSWMFPIRVVFACKKGDF